MDVEYIESEQHRLLDLLYRERHLVDIDLFMELAEKIHAELVQLERRLESCMLGLQHEINAVNGQVAEAERRIREAQQAIRNTPTTKTVTPKDGGKPTTQPINQDVIAKYKDTIAHNEQEIGRYQRRLSLLQQDLATLSEEETRLRDALSTVSKALEHLGYARSGAATDCLRYRQIILNAAACIDHYNRVRGSAGSYGAALHVTPKEG